MTARERATKIFEDLEKSGGLEGCRDQAEFFAVLEDEELRKDAEEAKKKQAQKEN
jgi:hypothetical protein